MFGPLACAWKNQVTQASQNNVVIIKNNLLIYYHNAQSLALKPATIQSALKKTRIYPLNYSAIPLSAFEPAKNVTTQAVQPLPAQLPSLLTPNTRSIPRMTQALDASPPVLTSLDGTPVSRSADCNTHEQLDEELVVIDEARSRPNQLTQQYHIEIPHPLQYTVS